MPVSADLEQIIGDDIPVTTLGESAATTWDAVVVGAGPAGSMAACQLARAGYSVLILDKSEFPRDKVCGGCLSYTALKTLAAAEMEIPFEMGGVPLKKMCLGASGANADVALPGGLALPRRVFDSHLLRLATRAGAKFLAKTCAYGSKVGNGVRIVSVQTDEGHAELSARVVLAAEGLNGRLLKDDMGLTIGRDPFFGASTTFGQHAASYDPSTIYMACGTGGYVGVVRFGDSSLHIGVALDPRVTRERGGIGAVSNLIIGQAGFPTIPGLGEASWKGTPTLTRRRGQLGSERLFVLGDAAGYVEPFTGEGMAWALADGRAVTTVAARAIGGWTDGLISQWTSVHHQLVNRRQWICRTMTRLLRYPMLVGPAVRILRVAPMLSAPFTRAVNSPYRAELFSAAEAS